MLGFLFPPAFVSGGEAWMWEVVEFTPFIKPEIQIRINAVVGV